MGFSEKTLNTKEKIDIASKEIRENNYDSPKKYINNMKNSISGKLTNFDPKNRDKYKLDAYERLKDNKIFQKLEEAQESYIFCLFYISQLAQTKTRAEVTPDEKQFFLDFQTMNQSLGIDYQLPPFKESRETQSINTMADVYHHADDLVQNPTSGFQDYGQSPTIKTYEKSIYKADQLEESNFIKMSDNRKKYENELTNRDPMPNRFDPKNKTIAWDKMDEETTKIVRKQYDQGIVDGKQRLEELNKNINKIEKDHIMSFVIKKFASLFMAISNYDGLHIGYDFSLAKIQSSPNGMVEIKGSLGGRKMSMYYNMATGELQLDNFLSQRFDDGIIKIDPDDPEPYKLKSKLTSFYVEYSKRPRIDITKIIKQEDGYKNIESKAKHYVQSTLDKTYKEKIQNKKEIQSEAITLVEKNRIVQDRLDICIPGTVKDMTNSGGINNADESTMRNVLKIWHKTINNSSSEELAKIGDSMKNLASFCKKLAIGGMDYNNLQNSMKDDTNEGKNIKQKMIDFGKELNSLESNNRGKAFAKLIGTTNGEKNLLVKGGQLQRDDMDTLVAVCANNRAIDPDMFSQNFKDGFYKDGPIVDDESINKTNM